MHLNRRNFLKWVLNASGSALLWPWLTGCDPSKQSSDQQAKTKIQGHLTVGSAVNMYTIDPALGFDSAIGICLNSLYDTLFRYVDSSARIIPWLVTEYNHSDDAIEWVFSIDSTARFHDGSPVTAESVVYSTKRLLTIGKGPANLFRGILKPDDVEAISRQKVRFRLLGSFINFPHLLTWLFVVNPKRLEIHKSNDYAQNWLTNHEAGSGPFTIETWVPGDRYKFKAVKDYWKGWPHKNHLKSYECLIIKDAKDRIAALEHDLVDMINWVPPDAQIQLKRKGFITIESPSLESYEIKLNNVEGYTANIHVRKAICYAFDYQALKNMWKERGVLMQGPLPYGMIDDTQNLPIYRQDMAKAKAQLAKSPWPQGGFSLDFVYVRGLSEERKTGEIIRKCLSELGIEVRLIPMAWADAVETFKDPRTSPSMVPIYSFVHPNPESYLYITYHSSHRGEWTNPGHYGNLSTDKLLHQLRSTVSITEKKRLYLDIQKRILDAAPNIFGISALDHHVFSPRIREIGYCPALGRQVDFYQLQLDDSDPRLQPTNHGAK